MCDIEAEIKKAILELKKTKNIQEWFKNIDDSIITDENIIKCIKNCKSPVEISEKDDKIQEKIKTIFNAFTLFKPQETRILILGQDPYPNAERAHGLAFSFGDNKIPADDSLLNIFKAIKAYKENKTFDTVNVEEIKGNIKKKIQPWNTNLKTWAGNNGILLLNTALTYKENEKHFNAWNPFIKQIISNLIDNMDKNNKLAVFLWGVPAQNLFYEAINENEKLKESFKDFIKVYTKYSKNQKGIVGKILIESYCYQKDNLKIFLTSHPSKQGFWRGFKTIAPNHFDCCDKFLKINGKKTWFDFPEKNEKH